MVKANSSNSFIFDGIFEKNFTIEIENIAEIWNSDVVEDKILQLLMLINFKIN